MSQCLGLVIIIYLTVTMPYGFYIMIEYHTSTLSENWCKTLFWPLYLIIWLLISVPKMIIKFAYNEFKNE